MCDNNFNLKEYLNLIDDKIKTILLRPNKKILTYDILDT